MLNRKEALPYQYKGEFRPRAGRYPLLIALFGPVLLQQQFQ
jgi:hypothetical protein